MNHFYYLHIILLSLLFSNPTHSQKDPFYVTEFSEAINFDGWVNEEEWLDIEPFDLKMQIPVENGTPTMLTEIRIAYDKDYVYLSGVMHDDEPDKIMANTKKRDALSASTQYFGFVIDSYNDNENGLAFFTTPTGIRWDLEISGDVVGRNPANISWNSFWDVKVQRDDQGWQAEIRVPFTTLAFEDNSEDVTMGITTWHYVARKNELDMYPLIAPDYGEWSTFKPSLAQDMVFRNVKSQKPFYITPYVLGGFSNSNNLNEEETAYENEKKSLREIGLDIKYGLSKNWTLDLSVNTDFAQVEADDQQVNLTRFSLFFPEKRLFFQERAGIFNFGFGGGTQLFYSRRIGLNEDSEPVRIYGGARVVGRSGLWDVGFLSMQTADDEAFDGENLSVLRAKRQIINNNSDAGFMITNRTNLDGSYNTSYGIDATIRWIGADFIEFKYASTISNEIENNKVFSLEPARIWLSMFTRRQKGFGYGTSFSRAGKDYNPSMGFENRENYTRFGNRVEYGWFPSVESNIFRHAAFARGSAHWDNETGDIQSLGWRVGWQMNTKNAWNLEFTLRPNIENLVEPFDLSDDAEIPVGRYDFINFGVEGSTSQIKALSSEYEIRLGQFYDGTINSLRITPTYSLSSSIELSGTYQYNKLNFNIRDESTVIHLARLNALYMFDTKLSISALMQYNSQGKNFSGNVRFRYNPTEGNDLFIVYNDDINTDIYIERPVLPNFNQRSIVIKYSYTFRP